MKNLNNEKYYVDFDVKGSCNYAFIILFNKKYRNLKFRKKFETILNKKKLSLEEVWQVGEVKQDNLI